MEQKTAPFALQTTGECQVCWYYPILVMVTSVTVCNTNYWWMSSLLILPNTGDGHICHCLHYKIVVNVKYATVAKYWWLLTVSQVCHCLHYKILVTDKPATVCLQILVTDSLSLYASRTLVTVTNKCTFHTTDARVLTHRNNQTNQKSNGRNWPPKHCWQSWCSPPS